jgi:hypothetical protein
VENVQFLFGGTEDTQTVTLIIYTESGDPVPGEVLFSSDYVLTGNNSAMQLIDLSFDDIAVDGGSIRVSVQFQHDGLPSLAYDTDGIVPGSSRLNVTDLGWEEASSLGLIGDLIIRALVLVE